MMQSPVHCLGIAAAILVVILPQLHHLISELSVLGHLILSVAAYFTVTYAVEHNKDLQPKVRRAHDEKATTLSRRIPIKSPRTSPTTSQKDQNIVYDSSASQNKRDYAEHVARVRDQQCPALLDACYLDAAAAPPFPAELVRRINDDLQNNLFSNPHSKSPSAVRTADMIESVRSRVMQELFGITNTHEWHLIFTSGATASMKLVGEAFDWDAKSTFACFDQSHTSLLGIRDLATKSGASFQCFAENEQVSMPESGLIGVPLQCNATGRRYAELARALCRSKGRAHVLLDAASYLSSSSHMDLSAIDSNEQPDFIAFSFYKIFGCPTGIGGLLVKASAASALCNKPYHGGGTVDAILPHSQWSRPRKEFVSRFEDGTVHFHGILAVNQALDYYKQTFGPLFGRKQHVQILTRKLFGCMSALRHANGTKVVRLYTTSTDSRRYILQDTFSAEENDQGPIINFNIQSAEGSIVPPQEVDRLASVSNIHLRMGRHCNAGFVVGQLGVSEEQLKREYATGISCDDADDSDTVSTSLRASLCLLNTDDDICRLINFIRRFFVSTASPTVRADEGAAEQSFRLETISIYPIKSCAGQDLLPDQRWTLTPHGLQHDREWVLTDLRNGKILSQKRFPQMALIRPIVDTNKRTMTITIARAGGHSPSIVVDIDDETQYMEDSDVTARVCSGVTRPRAHKSLALQELFSVHLGIPCTLAKQLSNTTRHSKLAGAGDAAIPLLFSNESPFLLINTASLNKVSELMTTPAGPVAIRDVAEQASDSGYSSSPEMETSEVGASAASFRANFVVSPQTSSKAAAWTEDVATRFTLGSHTFAVLGQCRRCQMVCIDQKTGEKKPETFHTLAKHRRNDRGRIIFGSHLTWMPSLDSVQADDQIWVGMDVQVSH